MKVLLVCSGNTCRSPMAAGLLRRLWIKSGAPAGTLEVISAGTGAMEGLEATTNAVAAMAEIGIDIAGHRSRSVDAVLLRSVDLVLAMTERHKEHMQMMAPDVADRIFALGEYAGLGPTEFVDPFGGPMDAYRQTLRSLEIALQSTVARIKRGERPG